MQFLALIGFVSYLKLIFIALIASGLLQFDYIVVSLVRSQPCFRCDYFTAELSDLEISSGARSKNVASPISRLKSLLAMLS